MAKSDIDEPHDTAAPTDRRKMVLESDSSPFDKSTGTTIHSGHFMVSCIDEISDAGEDAGIQDVKGYNFDNAAKETSRTYKFGSSNTNKLGIDDSLTELFECMSLAYRFVYTQSVDRSS